MIKISMIVPTYKRPNLLAELFENIDNQIFQAISTGDYINKNSKIIVLRIDENQMVVAMKDNKTT